MIDEAYREADLEAEAGLVWPENWTAARVFLACNWEREVVQGRRVTGTHFQGIATREIASAMQVLKVRAADRADVLAAVRLMAGTAGPILNEPLWSR